MPDHAPRTLDSVDGQLNTLPKPSRLDVRPLEPEGVATPANNKALSAFYALLNDRGHTQSPLKETRVSFAEVRAAAAAKGKYRRTASDTGLMETMAVKGQSSTGEMGMQMQVQPEDVKVRLEKRAKPDEGVKDGSHAFWRRGDKACLESMVVDEVGERVVVLRSIVLGEKRQ